MPQRDERQAEFHLESRWQDDQFFLSKNKHGHPGPSKHPQVSRGAVHLQRLQIQGVKLRFDKRKEGAHVTTCFYIDDGGIWEKAKVNMKGGGRAAGLSSFIHFPPLCVKVSRGSDGGGIRTTLREERRLFYKILRQMRCYGSARAPRIRRGALRGWRAQGVDGKRVKAESRTLGCTTTPRTHSTT